MWEDILASALPATPDLLTKGDEHTAGVAYAATRDEEAEAERDASAPPSARTRLRTCSKNRVRTSSPSPGRCSTAERSTARPGRRGARDLRRAIAPATRCVRRAVGRSSPRATPRRAALGGRVEVPRPSTREDSATTVDPAIVWPPETVEPAPTTSASFGWGSPSRGDRKQQSTSPSAAPTYNQVVCFCRMTHQAAVARRLRAPWTSGGRAVRAAPTAASTGGIRREPRPLASGEAGGLKAIDWRLAALP